MEGENRRTGNVTCMCATVHKRVHENGEILVYKNVVATIICIHTAHHTYTVHACTCKHTHNVMLLLSSSHGPASTH